MRDAVYAAVALSVALLLGVALGWHWRGQDFDAQVEAVRERVEQRVAAEKRELERALAHARQAAVVAEKAAESLDRDRVSALERASVGSGNDVMAINAHIAEVSR